MGLARPERPGVGAGTWVTVTPLDLTSARAWLAATLDANRAFTATIGALVLALVAMGTAIGGFGGPAAAAGLPPSLERITESFAPDDPGATPVATPEPTAEPSSEPTAAP